jgi:hypothetical protein
MTPIFTSAARIVAGKTKDKRAAMIEQQKTAFLILKPSFPFLETG